MSKRTSKHTLDEKVNIVRQVVDENRSIHRVSKHYQLWESTLKNWVYRYETYGMDGLKESKMWKHYSEETKQNAVKDYLNHKGSLRDISQKYQMSSTSVLRRWISKYTGGKSLKSTGKGMSKMTKGRKTIWKERVEIVQYTLARDRDYHGAAEKYDVSYQQVYSWVKKYESGGTMALQDRRGKGLASKETLTDEEQLQLKIKELEHRNQYLEAESGLLKKLKAIERRDPFNSVDIPGTFRRYMNTIKRPTHRFNTYVTFWVFRGQDIISG